jgi:hypothetical protein
MSVVFWLTIAHHSVNHIDRNYATSITEIGVVDVVLISRHDDPIV